MFYKWNNISLEFFKSIFQEMFVEKQPWAKDKVLEIKDPNPKDPLVKLFFGLSLNPLEYPEANKHIVNLFSLGIPSALELRKRIINNEILSIATIDFGEKDLKHSPHICPIVDDALSLFWEGFFDDGLIEDENAPDLPELYKMVDGEKIITMRTIDLGDFKDMCSLKKKYIS